MNVQQVAALAKLAISSQEEARMEDEFAQMLAFVQQLQGDAAPAAYDGEGGALRADEPSACLDREAVLALAPQRDGEYISVPKSFD